MGESLYSNTIVLCLGLKIALKLNQSITKKLSNENFMFISVASLFFHNIFQFKTVSLPYLYFVQWTCKTEKMSFSNYPSHANFNCFFYLSITSYSHFRKRLKKFLWHYIYMASSSNALILKGVLQESVLLNLTEWKDNFVNQLHVFWFWVVQLYRKYNYSYWFIHAAITG